MPDGWAPVSYGRDGHDVIGKTHMVYIYPKGEGTIEQLVTTAMQVAVEVYGEHGGNELVVGIMEGLGEDYPLETLTLYPNGCPANKQCMGDLWSSDVSIPASVLASVLFPAPGEAPAKEYPVTTTSSGLLEQRNDGCGVILAGGRDNLSDAQQFCAPLNHGTFEGIGPDGALLNLWVPDGLARDMLADQLWGSGADVQDAEPVERVERGPVSRDPGLLERQPPAHSSIAGPRRGGDVQLRSDGGFSAKKMSAALHSSLSGSFSSAAHSLRAAKWNS